MSCIPLGGGVNTDDANATASQILSGYTAYVKGKKVSGSIIDRSIIGKNGVIGLSDRYPTYPLSPGKYPQIVVAKDAKQYAVIQIPNGYYSINSYCGMETKTVGLDTQNILENVTIFGMGGSIPCFDDINKHGAIGINSDYPETPLIMGDFPQCNPAIDGNVYYAFSPPKGFFPGNGKSYVGINIESDLMLSTAIMIVDGNGEKIIAAGGLFYGTENLISRKSMTYHIFIRSYCNTNYGSSCYCTLLKNGSEFFSKSYENGLYGDWECDIALNKDDTISVKYVGPYNGFSCGIKIIPKK